MRIRSVVFIVVVSAIAAVLLYSQADPVGVKEGERAPEFAVRDGARELRLSDLRGDVVFLNFWASWCAPCVEEMPDMELIHRAFRDRKFRMIAVSADAEKRTVTDFLEQQGLTLPAYVDAKRKISEKYGVFAFPETFIIDATGRVVKHYIGPRRWARPEEMRSLDSMIRSGEQQ
jgi:cytochrome c biogenesis protein CcmG, thiol:disulfide interchange protein DsbE